MLAINDLAPSRVPNFMISESSYPNVLRRCRRFCQCEDVRIGRIASLQRFEVLAHFPGW